MPINSLIPFVRSKIEQHEGDKRAFTREMLAMDQNKDRRLTGAEQAASLSAGDYSGKLARYVNGDMPYPPSARVVDDAVITTNEQLAEAMGHRHRLSPKEATALLKGMYGSHIQDMRLSDLCRIAPPPGSFGCMKARNGQVMAGRRTIN